MFLAVECEYEFICILCVHECKIIIIVYYAKIPDVSRMCTYILHLMSIRFASCTYLKGKEKLSYYL